MPVCLRAAMQCKHVYLNNRAVVSPHSHQSHQKRLSILYALCSTRAKGKRLVVPVFKRPSKILTVYYHLSAVTGSKTGRWGCCLSESLCVYERESERERERAWKRERDTESVLGHPSLISLVCPGFHRRAAALPSPLERD